LTVADGRSDPGGRRAIWPRTACKIGLKGLKPKSLREHFAELDPDNRYGLATLPANELRHVHGCLAGNPRLAELLHAVLSSDPPALQPHEVGEWLSTSPAREVHQRLVRLYLESLPTEQQRVAEGLAALGIPVRSDAIIGVLDPTCARHRSNRPFERSWRRALF
jgi:hypothetical protein